MSKMTLGYASRTEAVEAMRGQGLSTRAIAAKIGIEVKTVNALEASALRRGGRRSAWEGISTSKQHTVCVDNDVLISLRPHATRRGVSVNQLIRQLIGILADDDLVDALLDDADEVRA